MQPAPHLGIGARTFIGAVIATGLLAVGASLRTLVTDPVSYHWSLLAGLTLLSGSFTVRIPTIPARLSVSDTFVFAAVLLFGPAAATMIVVLDSLVISLWLRTRSQSLSRILFNMAAPSVAIWIAAHIFYLLAGIQPLSHSTQPILPLLGPLIVLALVYFLLNTILVALAVGAEKRISAYDVWRNNFLWLSLNYFSGASVAALLLPYLQPEKPEFARVVGILLPLLLISYLTFKTAMGRVDDAHKHLSELNRLYLSTIETLAMAIDAKDQITHGHIRRVQLQAVRLAKAMGVKEEAQIRAIEAAALLHDMGKLAVPEYILNKPGPLTPAEFEKMKLHASVGADILSAIDFPYPVVPIVRHHHENWDGSGYPDRISGSAIPIGARILSVVDCFDALTSDRPYRPKLSDKDALKIVSERRGRMYDPLVVDTFLREHAGGGLDVEWAEQRSGPVATDLYPPAKTLFAANERLEDITSSSEEMLGLFDLARHLSGPLSVTEVGEITLTHLRRMIPTSLCAFYLNEIESGDLVCAVAIGEHASLLSSVRIPIGQRLSGWVAANKQTIRNSDPLLDLGESGRAISPRLRSCLSTPSLVGDEAVGVLSIYSTTVDGFTEEHQRILEVIARQIASAIQSARSRTAGGRSLQPLVQSGQSLSDHASESGRVVLILVSVSNVEKADLSGDEEANTGARDQQLAACIRRHIRGTDFFFRLRGGEFAIVQLEVTVALASSTADAVRRHVASEIAAASPRLEVRTSIATVPVDGEDIESVMAAARLRLQTQGISKQGPDSVH